MERSSIERYKLWCVLIALCHILGKNVHFCYCCYCSLLMALLPPVCDMSWGQWSFKLFPYLTWLCRVRPANLHGQSFFSFFFNFIEHIATLFIHVQYMYNKTKLLFKWPVFFYVFHNFVTTCSFMHHNAKRWPRSGFNQKQPGRVEKFLADVLTPLHFKLHTFR